jgi:hypothetical protein
MEKLELPIEATDLFSKTFNLLDQCLQSTGVTSSEFSRKLESTNLVLADGTLKMQAFAESLEDDGLQQGSGLIDGISNSLSMVNQQLSEAGNWLGKFDNMLQQLGLNAGHTFNSLQSDIHSLIGGFSSLLSMNPAGVFSGVSSIWSGLSGISDGLFGRGGLFGGDSDESMLKQAEAELQRLFGGAFDADVFAQFSSVINSIPRAASGGLDVLAASWHPQTVLEVLENIEHFDADMQQRWAANLEDHIKPVLMQTLKMSEADAARAMAPLFNEILKKVDGNSRLDSEFQRMINWAERLGAVVSATRPDNHLENSDTGSQLNANFSGFKQEADSNVINSKEIENQTRQQTDLLENISICLKDISAVIGRPAKVELNLDGERLIDLLLEAGGDRKIASAVNSAVQFKGC